jgi:hypothetical protein
VAENAPVAEARELEVGDWVRTALWPGIWNVYRAERDFFADRWDLKEPKVRSPGMLVFLRRIVTDTGKARFDAQVADESWVTKLDDDDQKWLEGLLREQPGLAAAFESYVPPPIDLVTNMSFGLPRDFSFDRFTDECERLLAGKIEAGLSLDEVLALFERSELNRYRDELPETATLQLVSPNHLRRGDEFVHTHFETLAF